MDIEKCLFALEYFRQRFDPDEKCKKNVFAGFIFFMERYNTRLKMTKMFRMKKLKKSSIE